MLTASYSSSRGGYRTTPPALPTMNVEPPSRGEPPCGPRRRLASVVLYWNGPPSAASVAPAPHLCSVLWTTRRASPSRPALAPPRPPPAIARAGYSPRYNLLILHPTPAAHYPAPSDRPAVLSGPRARLTLCRDQEAPQIRSREVPLLRLIEPARRSHRARNLGASSSLQIPTSRSLRPKAASPSCSATNLAARKA